LIDKGLQTKNVDRKSQKEPAYIPTDRGAEFADLKVRDVFLDRAQSRNM
jgi:hypothetical protein